MNELDHCPLIVRIHSGGVVAIMNIEFDSPLIVMINCITLMVVISLMRIRELDDWMPSEWRKPQLLPYQFMNNLMSLSTEINQNKIIKDEGNKVSVINNQSLYMTNTEESKYRNPVKVFLSKHQCHWLILLFSRPLVVCATFEMMMMTTSAHES